MRRPYMKYPKPMQPKSSARKMSAVSMDERAGQDYLFLEKEVAVPGKFCGLIGLFTFEEFQLLVQVNVHGDVGFQGF